jgi:hypothetical protein
MMMHSSPLFTAMVKASKKPPVEEDEADNVRLTISLPKPLYDEVQAMAKRDDRSLAFVIRKAIESHVHEDQPLLYPKKS